MANIRDVARVAGVSVTTVSATLNGAGRVSEVTQARIWAAVATVGYAPNAIARSLRLGRSRLIGLVVGDVTNAFWGALVHTIERVADRAGYAIIMCNVGGDLARSIATIVRLRSLNVAGILMSPTASGPELVAELSRPGLPPLVTVDHKVSALACDFVGVDNRATVDMLVAHLLRLGHRRIAMIHGQAGLWTADERARQFTLSLAAAGLAADPSLIPRAHFSGDGVLATTNRLMALDQPPTAIIGANNLIALYALQAVIERGLACPGDVSVAGIDEVPWSGLVRPRITTAAQPIEAIAEVAIEWLLERIASVDQPAPRERIFAPHFIAGQSCRDLTSTQDAPAARVPTGISR